MLLERFGLWEVRSRRVSTFSRGMQQRLGLCRVLLHDPRARRPRRAVQRARRRGGRAARRDARRARRPSTLVVATHDPERVERARDPPSRVRMSYASDVVALARKDLLLELRAKETLPAMLLFVLSALTIFHFALPARGGPRRGARPALDGARLHRVARADARVRARARAGPDGRAHARAVRPERDLGREVAVGARVPRARGARRTAGVLELLLGHRLEHGRRGRPRGHRHLRGRHAHRRDGGRRRAPASCSCRSSSCRSRSRSWSAASVRAGRGGQYLAFLALYDAIFVLLAWAAFEYVVAET